MRVVRQLTNADCGAACLATALSCLGRATGLDEVRQRLGTSRDGTSAFALVKAAEAFDVTATGLSVDVETLRGLPPPVILHWGFSHYVVLAEMRDGVADLLDPARGHVSVGLSELSRMFTGVAISLRPTPKFRTRRRRTAVPVEHLSSLYDHKALLGRALLASLALQLFGLGIPVITASLVDRAIPRRDYGLLTLVACGLLVLGVFQLWATSLRGLILLDLRAKLDLKLTGSFVTHLFSLPYTFFLNRSVGDIVARISSNSAVREALTSGVLSSVLDSSLVVGYAVVLWFVSVKLFVVAAACATATLAIYFWTRVLRSELAADAIQAQTRSQALQVELVGAAEVIKAGGSELEVRRRFLDAYVDELNAVVARARLDVVVEGLLVVMKTSSPIVVMLFAASDVMKGQLSLGEMLAVSAVAGGFLAPSFGLIATATRLQQLGPAIERLNDVVGATPEAGCGVGVQHQCRGTVELRAVSFRHAPEGSLVLQDVSLRVNVGEFVGVVGESGSGKSSLLRVILGLYRPTSGSVLFDDCVADEAVDWGYIRRQIGVVSQSVTLFGRTIRENIAGGLDLSLDEIERVARLAHVHDDICRMPLGYETMVGERGGGLSGGQQQRIALARALASRPPLLLLDEATSALDAPTEAAIHDNLSKMGCTRVVAAQRVGTLAAADRIVVLSGGRVVEVGAPAALLANTKSRFARLAARGDSV